MTLPQTTFVTNHQTEANRLIHVLVSTANGFYFRKKFAVLPYIIEGNAAVTYLPPLPFHKIKNGWQKWANLNRLDIPLNYPNDWVTEIMPLFPDLSENIAPHRQALEFEWHQTFPKVWEYLCNIFPSMQNDISHIEIRVTNYGTKMSYQGIPSIKDRTWTCYVRYDMPMSVAYEGLIQGILHAEQYKTLMTWEGRETIADFLINQLQLLGYFKEFKPTINALLTLDPALLIESHQYLQQLGLVFSKPLTIKDDDIYYHGKPISQLLTSTQNTLLYKLIQKNNCCTNYDELGAVLWNTDDHFSVWAINKAMSRLKERLKELNISAVIENKKGAGYYLINS